MRESKNSPSAFQPKSQGKDTKNQSKPVEIEAKLLLSGTARFSLYPAGIINTIPTQEVSLSELYELIRSDELKKITMDHRAINDPIESRENKAKVFEYITPHGVFSERKDEALLKHSGLMVLDFDNTDDHTDEIKNRLINDPVLCPAMVFTSPSGNGIKTIVRINPGLLPDSGKNRMMTFWIPINEYIKKNYGNLITPDSKGRYIDASGKDLSRACFVCYDPDVYLRPGDKKILDEEFVNSFTPKVEDQEKQHSRKGGEHKKVSPRTTLKDLADRHLSDQAHYDDYLKFVSAAANLSRYSQDEVRDYIKKHGNSDPKSCTKDPQVLDKLIKDVYGRYGSIRAPEKIPLDELSFAYDIFLFKWNKDIKNFVLHGLFHEGIRTILERAGYAKRYINPQNSILIKVDGNVIKEVGVENIKDYVTDYIGEFRNVNLEYNKNDIHIPAENFRNTYCKQSHLIFNEKWLQLLKSYDIPLLRDTRDKTYFAFENGLVTVTKAGISNPEPFSQMKDVCLYEDQIINRPFQYLEDPNPGVWEKFIYNISNGDEKRINAMDTAMGYLMHSYFSPSNARAVILNDEQITDGVTAQGRTGKGLIANGIKQMIPLVKLDGKEFRSDDKFHYQQVKPDTAVIWLDDPKKDFSFEVLYSGITDGMTVERKYLPRFHLKPEDSPKWLICANMVLDIDGYSNKGRQFVLELSDYYSSRMVTGFEEPIKDEHGGMFFLDWTPEEWNKFYSYMIDCVALYLDLGLIPPPKGNTEKNRLLQETNGDFVQWVEENVPEPGEYETKRQYDNFIDLYYGDYHQIGQRRFSGWIKKYAAAQGWEYEAIARNSIQFFTLTEKQTLRL